MGGARSKLIFVFIFHILSVFVLYLSVFVFHILSVFVLYLYVFVFAISFEKCNPCLSAEHARAEWAALSVNGLENHLFVIALVIDILGQ